MTGKSSNRRFINICAILPVLCCVSLFCIYYAGKDERLTIREVAFCMVLFAGLFTLVLWALAKIRSKHFCLTSVVCSLLFSLILFCKFPEQMLLPLTLLAKNGVQVIVPASGGDVAMSWAYWFRPASLKEDPFLWSPNGDISFSQLQYGKEWDLSELDGEPVLRSNSGGWIGISSFPHSHLAVLNFRVLEGSVELHISGDSEPIIITTEETRSQPKQIILTAGLLSDKVLVLVHLLIWSGFCFTLLILFSGLLSAFEAVYKKQAGWMIDVCAFLIPCFVLLILCYALKVCPFGERTFLINDMWGEYGDYMANFRRMLGTRGSIFYSFSKSLGDDLLSLLAFYVINPLNLLVCVFPPEKLPEAVSLLVILRYGICGLTSCIYFRKSKGMGWSALLFSTAYALMAFNFVNAENTNLREGSLIFPLVIFGLDRIVQGKSSLCYLCALTGTMFLNYYTAYQVCLFSVFYFSLCLWESPDEIRKKIGSFLKASFLAAGIASVLLIPVVLQLRGGPKHLDPTVLAFGLRMKPSEMAGKLLNSAYNIGQIGSGGLPSLYCGIFVLVLVGISFISPGLSRREKIKNGALLGGCVLVMAINTLDLIFHGLNFPGWWPYRYSFAVCFFMICIAAQGYSQGVSSFRQILMAVFIPVLICNCCLLRKYEWIGIRDIFLNLSFLAIFIVLITERFIKRKNSTISYTVLLALFILFDLGLNGYHILQINLAYDRTNDVSEFRNYISVNQPVIDEIKGRDVGFYRIEKNYWRDANDSMLLGYNGIAHYSSTLKTSIMEILPALGFRYYPYRFHYWEGSTLAVDSLLGIRYVVDHKIPDWKPYPIAFELNERIVKKNPFALPIGFMVGEDIPKDLEIHPSFSLQNEIFEALSGLDQPIFTDQIAEIILQENLKSETDGCLLRTDMNEVGRIEWNIPINRAGTLYAFFPSEKIYPARLIVNGESHGEYFDNFSTHIVRLGEYEPGEEVSVSLETEQEKLCFAQALFAVENTKALEAHSRKLTSGEVDLNLLAQDHITGKFTADTDGNLFFTIPFDKGWTLRIDGEKIETHPALSTFLSAKVSKGEHQIDLTFCPQGFRVGFAVTFLSLVIAVFLFLKEEKNT